MKIKNNHFNLTKLITFIASGILFLSPTILRAQHVHVNAGATSTAQDAPLLFLNSDAFDATAGYAANLTFTNSGSFSNLYQGGGFSFTALPSTPDNGGPEPGHAANGAFLQLQFVSLNGPPNGELGVWLRDHGDPTISHPLFTMTVGENNGTNLLALTESDGSPDSDPYGHIHGRTFAATKPGLYTVGLRIVDTSTNGINGQPIHQPSELYHFNFQAGLTISSAKKDGDSFSVTFAAPLGKIFHVESTPDISAATWTTFAGPIAGDNYLKIVTTNSAAPELFFRIRSD